MSDSSSPAAPVSGAFAPTRWTLVLRTQGDSEEARTALGELCAAYWDPVFRFLRREGRGEDAARELAQDFFARVLSGRGFPGASPERGRFRSFLLGALKHFLGDLRDHERAAKRGGGVEPERLEAATDSHPGFEVASPESPAADCAFDRQWALAVMARSLGVLEAEQAGSGRGPSFAVLKAWLVGDAPALSQSEAARQLGWTEGAVKVAVHRMRRRFREIVRSEVAQTVPAAADVDEELRYLVDVLSAG
ncbi:MAG: sigma-70 family RNA polymerase sigma factor [Verrucomicrobiae bacterium]|nr:sigma-70 family RNA polymerase sigma factor [Verrucomicrobiae bacterium]